MVIFFCKWKMIHGCSLMVFQCRVNLLAPLNVYVLVVTHYLFVFDWANVLDPVLFFLVALMMLPFRLQGHANQPHIRKNPASFQSTFVEIVHTVASNMRIRHWHCWIEWEVVLSVNHPCFRKRSPLASEQCVVS